MDLEQALTALVWAEPSLAQDPAAALARLGVDLPDGVHLEIRVQRRDTLYFVIPPSAGDGGGDGQVLNQMDLWGSGDQFIWIMPQDTKLALLEMREQCRRSVQAG